MKFVLSVGGAVACATVFFQNCGAFGPQAISSISSKTNPGANGAPAGAPAEVPGSGSSGSTGGGSGGGSGGSGNSGGDGYYGKVYVELSLAGKCPDGSPWRMEIENPSGDSFILVRDNCAKVNPVAVNAARVPGVDMITYEGRLLEPSTAVKNVAAIQYCQCQLPDGTPVSLLLTEDSSTAITAAISAPCGSTASDVCAGRIGGLIYSVGGSTPWGYSNMAAGIDINPFRNYIYLLTTLVGTTDVRNTISINNNFYNATCYGSTPQ